MYSEIKLGDLGLDIVLVGLGADFEIYNKIESWVFELPVI